MNHGMARMMIVIMSSMMNMGVISMMMVEHFPMMMMVRMTLTRFVDGQRFLVVVFQVVVHIRVCCHTGCKYIQLHD